jgi:hypothetical protein
MATYQRGGQRRTIEAGCGWRCVGHPQEVNGKFRLHKKYCETCRENHTQELPSFNKEAGNINGWKGITNRNQQPNQMLTTAFIKGEQYDIFSGANNLQKAMDETYLTANLIAGGFTQAEPVLTKSQKKRRNKKAKKQAEKDEDIITDAVLKHIPNDIMDKFCDKYEEDADEDKATWELAELIAGNMTDEEVAEMLNRLK